MPRLLVSLALIGLAAAGLALGGPVVRLMVLPAALVLVLLVATVVLWRGARRGTAGLAVALALAVTAASGWYWSSLHQQLSEIPRVDDAVLDAGTRPPPPEKGALTFLLLGADARDTGTQPSVADLMESDQWSPGSYRSDTVVVVHIPEARRSATVVSLPRDSYVRIHSSTGEPGRMDKLNAAFALHGPFGAMRTVENLTGLRLAHMAVLDFEGFRDLTTALGGVEVYVPERVTDTSLDRVWERGWVTVEGEEALDYVRSRSGFADGDFGRIRRQQNFLRAVVAQLGADGTTSDPVRLMETVEALAAPLTVDSSWTPRAMASLALSVRGIGPDRIRFLTLPFDRYETVEGVGSVNIVDEELAARLFRAMRVDRVAAFVEDHPELELPDADEVR
jgi:LCP family protein required for cell wall assembly